MILAVMPSSGGLMALAGAGIVAGLVLLVRGFAGHRAADRVSGTSPSRIASLAIGEVLVSGTAEPIELTLISPLQSTPCVYYRARVTETRDDRRHDLLREERAVGFRVRDATGAVRVFPSGARFDVPDRFDESSSAWGGTPVGLEPRTGPVFAPGPEDREAAIARLLTVRDPGESSWFGHGPASIRPTGGGARYREARIEAGDTVTVVGRVLPFSELDDPTGANLADGAAAEAADPEVAADLAEAREAGLLASTPEAAWGNAAIEGFGIGRPVRPPDLDPDANRPPPPDPALAARATAAFQIAPDALILATSQEVPMVISLGAPTQVAARAEWQFVVGLAGAALAIASAMGLALLAQGGLR